MNVDAGGAEAMFLDVKELAVRKLNIRKSYAPGSIDYHTTELKQIAPLDVVATAELIDGQIRITGHLETKIELQCARCLDAVVEDVHRQFDLFYSPMPKDVKPEEERLKDLDAEIAFYQGNGLFLGCAERTGAALGSDEGDLQERLPRLVRELRREFEP